MHRLLASFLVASLSSAAGAQQLPDPTVSNTQTEQVVPTILTVDIDRLFAQSQFGGRISTIYTEGRIELAEENRRIADALREEELALAAQRSDMDVDVFRTEAETFDTKAQAIRRAQDTKESALEATLTDGRDRFLVVTRPILGQLMVDRGAYAILDRRSVFLSLGSIEITDDAIARIDAAIGSGVDQSPTDASDN